uniref:HHH_2 domain-containing protein n=1 Tax=Syphacia muris TaxID=451379 RepID=A0A0N5AJS5_9BILA
MESSVAAVTSSSGKIEVSRLGVNRKRQEGNPVLKYVRNVPFEWAEIKADFESGKDLGVLYLSLKWHKLHPGYIESRLDSDGSGYRVKVLLVLVNVEPRHLLRELNIYCWRTRWSLVLCYSVEEAAEYLENIHLSRNKDEYQAIYAVEERKKKRLGIVDVEDVQGKEFRCAVELLASIRSVTKADAQRLISTFGSLKVIGNADVETLLLCPGLGSIKAQNVYKYFRTPFRK